MSEGLEREADSPDLEPELDIFVYYLQNLNSLQIVPKS